jgi:hypothetical protein
MSRGTGEGEGFIIFFIPLEVECILSECTDKGVNLLVLLSTHAISFLLFSVCRSADVGNVFVLVIRLLVVVADVKGERRRALMLF